jgi:TrpR-related protein YerC/YecD
MRKTTKKDVQALYEAILSLKTIGEAKRFFRDLLTKTEIQEFSERWKTARMLDAGIPYSQIAKDTGNSSTTIARVSRWLKSGKGGYRLALQRTRKMKLS